MMPKLFTRFTPQDLPGLKCSDASLTRQEFVQESDINNIMKRYAAGMPMPSGNRPPVFDDFSNIPDYQSSFELVERSNELFMQLPSAVRERFRNDPRELLAFLNDSKNRDEAVTLGLIDSPDSPAEAPSEKSVSVPPPPAEGAT